MSKPNTKPVCSHCGSDDVLVDAFASWNPETRKYELENTFDDWICKSDECDGGECSVDWVDIDAQTVASDNVDSDIPPVEPRAAVLVDCYYCGKTYDSANTVNNDDAHQWCGGCAPF